ncbi:MAG: YbjN domain-containing protein, partial [Bryobacteraceae bacterium]
RRFGVLAVVACSIAAAQTPAVLKDVTQEQVSKGLESLGYKATTVGNTVQFASGDSTVTVSRSGSALTLSAPLRARLSVAEANDWNQKNLYSRVLVAGPSARLQSDLNLRGGVTAGALDAFVKEFVSQLSSFSAGSPNARSGTVADSSLSVHTRSQNAKTEVKTPFGDFSVWVDLTKWKQSALPDEPKVIQFESLGGDAYAKVISEKAKIPKNSLREVAVENARKADPNIKVILKEERIVNGRHVGVMQMDGVVKNLPIVYYGYYYGGSSGSVQVVCFTLKGAFEENLARFTELLDGLEVHDEPLPDTEPRITVSELKLGNKLTFSYNSTKWKQTKQEEPGRYSFTFGSGTGYGLLIYEGLSVPLDNLPEVALTNAKAADPNATLVSRDKITVNGIVLWRQKMNASVNGVPVSYYGYYYGGDGGTVQVLTYCGQGQLPELEAELTEFLSGLQFVP